MIKKILLISAIVAFIFGNSLGKAEAAGNGTTPRTRNESPEQRKVRWEREQEIQREKEAQKKKAEEAKRKADAERLRQQQQKQK